MEGLEQHIQVLTKNIRGGVLGISEILADYNLLQDSKLVQHQITKEDIFTYTIKDIAYFEVHQLINSLIVQITETSIDKIKFTSYIDSGLFANKSRIEESVSYVNNSNLENYEKEKISDVIIKNSYSNSALSQLENIYDESLGYETYQLSNVISDFSLEIEFRKKVLRTTLDKLDKAILESVSVVESSKKAHLISCASIQKASFEKMKESLEKSFFEYLPPIESSSQQSTANSFSVSKQDSLEKLVDGTENLEKYYLFEKLLYQRGYINKDLDYWQESSVKLIRFYCFCEKKKMFKVQHTNKRTGIKILREIYNFQDGNAIDYPNKRKKEMPNASAEFFFLPI